MEDPILCIACSRVQPSPHKSTCDCGHVLKDAIKRENTRRRKAPIRLDSISSEWVDLDNHISSAKINVHKKIKSNNEKKRSPLRMRVTQNKRYRLKSLPSNKATKEHVTDPKEVEKRGKSRELLEIIENSYKNCYFTRCKSYRKTKIIDLDFEFDYSAFESDCPYYPKALEDINGKIRRMNGIWNDIN